MVERAETRDVLNLILNTPKLSAASLDSLQEIDLDFTSYTQKSQLFFFPKVSIEILPGEMKEYKQTASTLNNYVWAENVIQHNFKQLPPMFEIKREIDDEGHTHYDILIKNTGSKFFDYLVNTSRLYWRKELEYNFEDKTLQEKKDYHSNNRYRIDGEGLSEEEIEEQYKQEILEKLNEAVVKYVEEKDIQKAIKIKDGTIECNYKDFGVRISPYVYIGDWCLTIDLTRTVRLWLLEEIAEIINAHYDRNMGTCTIPVE